MTRRKNILDEFTLITSNPDDTEDWLKEAGRFLNHAATDLHGDHANSVAQSSKAIEYSAKSLLTLAGFEFPEVHWVGQGLVLAWKRLSGHDSEQVLKAKRQLARVGWLCDMAAPLQNISEYGYAGKRARYVINETDAATFYRYGEECLDIARRFLKAVRGAKFRFKESA
jgi:HEPN domain-containing protein